jgi:hypothetical protein
MARPTDAAVTAIRSPTYQLVAQSRGALLLSELAMKQTCPRQVLQRAAADSRDSGIHPRATDVTNHGLRTLKGGKAESRWERPARVQAKFLAKEIR